MPACVSSKTQLIPLLLQLHLCGHAIFIRVAQTAAWAYLCTHTQKLTNTHTTAVKCHTNTFYRPPLTSLIRTLHLKVGEKKETDLLTRYNTDLYNGGIACRSRQTDFVPLAFSFLFGNRSLFFFLSQISITILLYTLNSRLFSHHQEGIKHAETHIISPIASSFLCTGAKTTQ